MTEIHIKKYENRRLYCVPKAKYVSLTEIKEMIQEGNSIKVIEKKSGKDITKYVLMQVLLEERYELLPTHFYQIILQSPKKFVENFFDNFFPWMLDIYLKNQTPGPGMGMPVFQNPWMQNMQMQNPFMTGNPFMQELRKSSSKEPEKSQIDEIMKKLKELEDKIK